MMNTQHNEFDGSSAPLLQSDEEQYIQSSQPVGLSRSARLRWCSFIVGLVAFSICLGIICIFLSLPGSSPSNDIIKPSYIIYNATIYTPNPLFKHNSLNIKTSLSSSLTTTTDSQMSLPTGISPFDRKTAIVIDSTGRYYDIGTDTLLDNPLYKTLPQINLQGYTISPGWSDSHGHIMSYGLGLLEPDVRTAQNISTVISMLLHFAEEEGLDPTIDPGYWVLGGRWDESQWSDDPDYGYFTNKTTGSHPFPNHQMLDKTFSGLGIALKRIDGHACWVNNVVLNQIKLPDIDPVGGKIIRDDDGKPTGVLIDYACDIVFDMPQAQPTVQMSQHAMTQTLRDLNRAGITNIHDAMIGWDDMKLFLSQIQRKKRILGDHHNYLIENNNKENNVLNEKSLSTQSSQTSSELSKSSELSLLSDKQHLKNFYDPFPLRIHGFIDAESICGPFGYRCPSPLPFSWVDIENPVRLNNGSKWVEPLEFKIIENDDDNNNKLEHEQLTSNTLNKPAFSILPFVFATTNGRLSAHGAKLIGDGALGSWGAYLTEPYTDKSTEYGYPIYNSTKLYTIISNLVQQGFQLAVHAIGDGAVKEVLETYISVATNLPSPAFKQRFRQMRHRIEHFQILPKGYDYYSLMTEWGVYPSMQPIHAVQDRSFAEERLGIDRLQNDSYQWRKTLDHFGLLPLGTDFPVASPNVIANIYAAVTMQQIGYDLPPFLPNHTITIDDALMGVTADPAFIAHREKTTGSIQIGNTADFIILSNDILKAASASDTIKNTTILATFIDGNIVYEHQSLDLQINATYDDTNDKSYSIVVNDEGISKKSSDWYAIKLPSKQNTQKYMSIQSEDIDKIFSSICQHINNQDTEKTDSLKKHFCSTQNYQNENDNVKKIIYDILLHNFGSNYKNKFTYITVPDRTKWMNLLLDDVLLYINNNDNISQASYLNIKLPKLPQYSHYVYSDSAAPTSHQHKQKLQSRVQYSNGFRGYLPPCVAHSANREYTRRAQFIFPGQDAQLIEN